MKKCPKCGNLCEDESVFCGECGYKLQQKEAPLVQSGMQGKSKNTKTFILVAIILVLVGVIAFLAWKMHESENFVQQADSEKTVQQNNHVKTVDEKSTEEKVTETETDIVQEADINAVDKAIFDINGKLVSINSSLYLEIDKPVSVYAPNEKKENVLIENVAKFKIQNGDELEKYVGKSAVIKGKVVLEGNDKPVLKLESYEIADVGDGTEDTAIHTYQIIVNDCTWEEAFEQCRQMGGYLVRINSYEEYAAIVSQIQNEGYEKVHFYLGGRRDFYGSSYYWVNEDNELMDDGPALNSVDAWSTSAWMTGEPSYVDGDIQEMYMNMFYYKSNLAWVLNDVPDDITGVYPGQTGYICEFEN